MQKKKILRNLTVVILAASLVITGVIPESTSNMRLAAAQAFEAVGDDGTLDAAEEKLAEAEIGTDHTTDEKLNNNTADTAEEMENSTSENTADGMENSSTEDAANKEETDEYAEDTADKKQTSGSSSAEELSESKAESGESYGWVEYVTGPGGSISVHFAYEDNVYDEGTYTFDMMEFGPWEAQYETVGILTVNALPDEGYQFEEFILTDEDGIEIASSCLPEYSFHADPERDITVTAAFMMSEDYPSEEGSETDSEMELDPEEESDMDSEPETGAMFDANTEPEAETEAESVTETETESESENDSEETMPAYTQELREIDGWPLEQSSENLPRAYIWYRDIYFDLAGYQYYGDDVYSECQTDLSDMDHSAGSSVTVTYKCTLKQEDSYFWYATITFYFVENIGSATLKSDECDYIMPSVITQSLNEGYDGIVPELAGTEVEGREYCILAGDETFDIYGLATDYNDDYFKVSMYDDGGFDVNAVGDYTVVYSMSYYLYPDYAWYVINNVHVVAGVSDNGITVITEEVSMTAEAEDGKAEYGIWYHTESADFTMTVSDAYDLSLSISATRDGEEVAPHDYVTVSTGESSLEKTAVFSIADATEHCYVFTLTNEEGYDGKVLTNGGGWLPLDVDTAETLETADEETVQELLDAISDAIAENDGDTSSLLSGEESIAAAVGTDANAGIMTAASVTSTTTVGTFSASGKTGASTGNNHYSDGTTSPETNYAYVYASGYASTINKLLDSGGFALSVDDDDLGTFGIYCVSGHSYYGWTPNTSITVTVTVKVKEYSDGSFVVVLSVYKSGKNSSYQTFAGSYTVSAEPDTATIQIRKSVVGYQLLLSAELVSDVKTTFAVYEARKKNGEYVMDSSTLVATLKLEDDTTTDLIVAGSGNYKMRGLFTIDAGTDYIVVETYRIKGTADFTDYIWGPYTDIQPGEVRTLGYINGKKSNGVVEDYAQGSDYARVDGDTYVTNWARAYNGAIVHKYMDTDEDGEYDDTEEPLPGAVFKVEYYNTSYVSKQDTSGYPVIATWYFMTDEDGMVYYNASHYLSSWTEPATGTVYTSDALFDYTLTRNRYRLPVGSLKITEVEAPEGCVLESDKEYTVSLCSPTGEDGKLDATAITLVMRDENDVSSHIYESGIDVPNYPETGYLKLTKKSGNEVITDGNVMYSLLSTTYGVYTNEECTVAAMAYVRDDSGEKTGEEESRLVVRAVTQNDGSTTYESNTTELEPGTYYIKEISAGEGYELDHTVYAAEVVYNETSTVSADTNDVVYDTPMVYYTGLIVKKTTEASTSMPLAGGVFKVEFYAGMTNAGGTATRTWYLESDTDGNVYFDETSLASGYSSSAFYMDSNNNVCLPLGFLKISEVEAPEGFVVSDVSVTYSLTADRWGICRSDGENSVNGVNTTTVSTTIENNAVENAGYIDDNLIFGGILIPKVDAETDTNETQGTASLANAVFSVISLNSYDVCLKGQEETTYSYGEEVLQITTDEEGIAETGAILQYGTYKVVEVIASDGYWLDDRFEGKANIVTKGSILSLGESDDAGDYFIDVNDTVSDRADTVDQIPRRSDLDFMKVNIDGETKAYIPFLISAIAVDEEGHETVLESHVIVADTDGVVDTSRTHSENTNGFDQYVVNGKVTEEGEAFLKDASSWGIWFGEPDAQNDEYGALYTSCYRITEIQCEANASLNENLLESELLNIYNDTGALDEAMIDNDDKYHYHPMVDTEIVLTSSASDAESGTQTISIRETSGVEDKVDYTHVSADHTYRMETKFVDITDANNVLEIVGTDDADAAISDNGLWVTKEFQPEKKSGTNNTYGDISMSAILDTTGLNGHTIVAVDYLYEYINGYWILVAKHEDYSDEDQMLYVPDIHTNAVDGQTGSRVGTKSGDASILDTVTYSNLAKGEMYVITMQVVNAATGEATENGKTVSSKRIYSRSNTPISGTVVMPEFTLDSSAFDGDVTLVVIESLFRADEDGNPVGEAILVHDSLVDENQTIRYPDVHTMANDDKTGDDVGTSSGTAVIYDEVIITNVVFDDNDLEGNYSYTVKGRLVYQEDCTDADGIEHQAGEALETLEGTLDTVTITSDASGNATFTYADGTSANGSVAITEHGLNVAKLVEGGAADNSYVTDTTAAIATITVELMYKVDASKLKGTTAVVFEDLYHNDVMVAGHADLMDEAQSVHFPEIHTTATDADTAGHTGTVDEEAVIHDKVSYRNLVVGKEYTMTGILMNRETGLPLLDESGNEITAISIFTADTEGADERNIVGSYHETNNTVDGTYVLTFTLDSSLLAGKTVVVFESLYHNDVEVTSHADITDNDQSVYYPGIRTTAVDSRTGDHAGSIWGALINTVRKALGQDAGEETKQTITDTVALSNLVPGQTYVVSGQLYNATESLESGEDIPLVIDGEEITRSVTITVSEDGRSIRASDGSKTSVTAYNKEQHAVDGEVDLIYTLDSSKIQGVKVVVFEKLYQDSTYTVKTNPDEVPEEDLVNEHADIEDEGQSVSEISICTTAVDTTTGNHVGSVPDSTNTTSIHDEVHLAGLVEGMEYTIEGALVSLSDSDFLNGTVLYLQADGTLTDDRSKAYTERLAFTAEQVSETHFLNFAITSEQVQGKSLTVFENIYHRDVLISSHPAGDGDEWDEEALAEQTVYYPAGKTNATDTLSGEQMSLADSERTIIDRVYFENLLVGQEYAITGQLVYKEAFTDAEGVSHTAGEALTDKVTVSFTAMTDLESAACEDGSAAAVDGVAAASLADGQTVISGYVSISFTVDASKLAGATLVAFESFSHKGVCILTHNDLEDLPQTIKIPEIRTMASINGVDEAAIYNSDGSCTDIMITDTVSYRNLWTADEMPDMTYILKGVLMDKETGEALADKNGNICTAYSEAFVPESAEGTYDVTFKMNADDFTDENGKSMLAGKSLVVYEELFVASSPEDAAENNRVAEHRDLDDDAQTVRILDSVISESESITETNQETMTETVTETVKETEPETSVADGVKTQDVLAPRVLAMILLLGAAMLVMIYDGKRFSR